MWLVLYFGCVSSVHHQNINSTTDLYLQFLPPAELLVCGQKNIHLILYFSALNKLLAGLF